MLTGHKCLAVHQPRPKNQEQLARVEQLFSITSLKEIYNAMQAKAGSLLKLLKLF